MPLLPVTASSCPHCAGTLWRRCYDGVIRLCSCEGVKDSRENWIYHNKHKLILLCVGGRASWVDEGIADDVSKLWEAGIWTWASCQGGGTGSCRYMGICDRKQVDAALLLLPWVKSVYRNGFGSGACMYAIEITRNDSV